MAKKILKLNINGSPVEMATSDNRTLSQFLREEMNLTGTKVGCDMGSCGCCTVTVNGRPRLACLTLAMECAGSTVETIESLKTEELHPLQRAFSDCGGSQCGFCTPGFIMTAKNFLEDNPDPTRDQIKDAVAGNLCRCTGFVKIYDAIERAACELRGDEPVTAPTPEPETVGV